MKTVFFTQFNIDEESNKSFVRDLNFLLKLKLDKISKIETEYLRSYPTTLGISKKDKLALAETIGISEGDISSSWNVIGYLVRSLSEKDCENDTPENLTADLKNSQNFADVDEKKLLNFFLEIKNNITPKFKEYQITKKCSVGILPSLNYFATTVELRAAIDPRFEYETALEDYNPQIKQPVPIISVKLSTDSDSAKELFFQASPEKIQLLIKELQAALLNLKKFEEYVRKK